MTYKQLSILRLFALNAMSGCIDLVYAVEGAYFVPAIFDSGISHIYGAMLISISPFMGIIFQSYMGTASDQCQCFWGRRRPFILALTITCLIGLLLFPFTEDIADLINQQDLQEAVLIVLVVIATFFSDFSAGSLLGPVRAYLLDVVPQNKTKTGNIIYSICVSIGAAIGFGIGSIKWSSIFTSSNDFSFQVKFVCIVTCFLVILCIIITLCSVKEQNPREISDDEEINLLDEHSKGTQTDFDNSLFGIGIDTMSIDEIFNHSENCDFVTVENGSKYCCSCFGNLFSSIKGNFIFMKYMSLSMIILCIAFFFSLVGLYTQIYFFTTYMAEVVYDGDVDAPDNSTAYENYTDGVAFGSLALGIAAIVALVVSLLLGPIIRLVGMRLTLVTSYILLMLQSGVLIVSHNAVVAAVLAPAIYISLIVILAIPFILVSIYETKGLLLRKTWPYPSTNLTGRACSVLCIALFMGQAFALIVNGPLINLYGSAEAVMILTCVTSFLGAVTAGFVTVPSDSSKKVQIGSKMVDASCQTTNDRLLLGVSNPLALHCVDEDFDDELDDTL
ncbi:membrane-associated transporter protein-like [Dysidea avara]|uniref:membrane-associated transporter protein-like n=1 Tax=Dysidea avara TaxID=196820 RepID=UPI00331BD295